MTSTAPPTAASPANTIAPSSLQLLDPPARLRIPLATHAPADVPPGIVIGTTVAKGQALAALPSDGGPSALAPVSGRVAGIVTVTLTSGQSVPAVELEV